MHTGLGFGDPGDPGGWGSETQEAAEGTPCFAAVAAVSLHAWQTRGTGWGGALVSRRWGPKFQLCYRYWRSLALASALASMFPAPSRRPVTAGAAAGLRGNTSGPHTRFPCCSRAAPHTGSAGEGQGWSPPSQRRGAGPARDAPGEPSAAELDPGPERGPVPASSREQVVSSTPQGICLEPPPLGGHWLFGRR